MTMLFLFLEISLFQQCMEHFYDICAFTRELRIACTVAQMEREGGISPRLSPLAQACIIVEIVGLIIYLSVIYILKECNSVSFEENNVNPCQLEL